MRSSFPLLLGISVSFVASCTDVFLWLLSWTCFISTSVVAFIYWFTLQSKRNLHLLFWLAHVRWEESRVFRARCCLHDSSGADSRWRWFYPGDEVLCLQKPSDLFREKSTKTATNISNLLDLRVIKSYRKHKNKATSTAEARWPTRLSNERFV